MPEFEEHNHSKKYWRHVSNNFDNYIEKERHNYSKAKPYPHIVINNEDL